MAIRRKLIREMVQSLLKKHKVQRGEVPVETIVKSLGIIIKIDEVNENLSGFVARKKGSQKAIIGVNKAHHPNRQRFTIAHELGHYLLHEGEQVHLDTSPDSFTINLRNSESSKGENNDEREANLFAAELLMPAELLREELESVGDIELLGSSEFLEKLATKYKVSVQALTFRLAYLGYIKL
jgi:Zn-dependent peptidase ImmA (M78 family)